MALRMWASLRPVCGSKETWSSRTGFACGRVWPAAYCFTWAISQLTMPDTLYGAARALDWSEHLSASDTIAVDCTARHAAISHSQFAALRIKDAVVDSLRTTSGQRPSVDVQRPAVRLRLHLDGDLGQLWIDLAGESLHRRGYRAASGPAPIKENLAAAVLRRARWAEACAEGLGLLDPMCGSATLLIEAAMIAGDRAPGLGRDYFGFVGWRGHQPDVWRRLVEEARARAGAGDDRSFQIMGRDADRAAVEHARANVRAAGFEGRIAVEQVAFTDAEPPWRKGLLVVNAPYGERLGDEASVAALYDALGDGLSGPYADWRAAILTGADDVSGRLRRRIKRRHRFFNGNLEVELLSIDPLELSENVIPLPVAADIPIEPFVNRLQKNRKRLASWLRRDNVSCYRVYDADIPEFSAAIDVYGEWVHLQEYAAPASIEPARARARLEAMREALPSALDIVPERVVVKTRVRQRGRGQYNRLDSIAREFEVREGPARYLVNLDDYLDTGLFLDHRPTRARLFELAEGHTLLNLFCYTGSMTVAAALGGARATVSVDTSATYLDWAARNFALNRLARQPHQLVRADVRTWLERYDGPRFELVFCDPPTFSNSKSRDRDFEVGRDHVDLVRATMAHVTPDGMLLFSSNKRRFGLDAELSAAFDVTAVGRRSVPPDFARGAPPHQLWEIRWPRTSRAPQT